MLGPVAFADGICLRFQAADGVRKRADRRFVLVAQAMMQVDLAREKIKGRIVEGVQRILPQLGREHEAVSLSPTRDLSRLAIRSP